MKKIIILVIAIILPLVGAVMIGWYGISVRYEPEQNPSVASLFKANLNKGVITSEGRIKNYRQFENYYYDEAPLFLETIENESGKAMFTLAIYRAYYYYQPSADDEVKEKVKFEVFIYDVNYNLVKNYFTLDDRTVIDEAQMPKFSITFTPTNGKDPFTVNLTTAGDVMIQDYNSVPEWTDKTETKRNYVQSSIIRTTQTLELAKFSSDANIKVEAKIEITGTDSKPTTLLADKPLVERYLSDFESDIADLDTTNYLKGFREPSVVETFKNAGYYQWLLGRYLWWQGLIAIVLVGFVTGTFYLVWTFEEPKRKTITRSIKKKKKK
ncbi:MAG TPA: hypothetical protein VJZ51_00515 [Bacilli bacterium]|nr:hypothetical protein [Bacilli bacterium]